MYSGVRRQKGVPGFEAMFAPRIVRWTGEVVTRPQVHPDSFTTCNQAEALYPGEIPLPFIQHIYAPSEDVADAIHGMYAALHMDPLPVQVSPEKFR
jgi:hypothetical protein